MSVIGIDFGDESCYIAVARQGGIETLANDYSLRATPSCVAFTEKNRVMGVAAKNQTTTNMKNTIQHFKHFIGTNFSDPRVQKELSNLPYALVEDSQGKIAIKVRYQNEEHSFSPTEITAMLFTKLKLLAETALDIKVNDVVIGVPSYFNDTARHELLAAAQGAGLRVLRLFNETAATALAYGIYKQDLPAPEEKPRNVFFVDCGYSSLQVSAAAFHKGKLKMLATTFDDNLGGRDFDRLIAHHLAAYFKKTYKVDATTNKKAFTKLLAEVEKLKKQMSANSTNLPINIECFMDDKDVSGRMNRAEFEEMAADCLTRVEATLVSCLNDSGLTLEDIHSVEIVGGSSRVPAIKQLIEKVFKKTSSTTLNQDEAVARGCALQCAMLSPTFKVREFSIQDVQPFSIRLLWTDENNQRGDMEVFSRNHQVPFSKMLTFQRKGPFTLRAEYDRGCFPGPEGFIGEYSIHDIPPSTDGASQKVKVKVRVNLHGNFLVSGASLTKKEEQIEEQAGAEEPMEEEEKKSDAAKSADESAKDAKDAKEAPSADSQATEKSNESEKKPEKKKTSRTVELPVVTSSHEYSTQRLDNLMENESKMAANDRLENDRINAKNAVEEYVYDLRSKLYEELEGYVAEEERASLSKDLEDTENWLYEDGEDCQKQVYVDKLNFLKEKGEPIKERKRERQELPRAFENLMAGVQRAKKITTAFYEGDEKFNHLDSAEVEKVDKAINEKIAFAEQQMGAVRATSNFQAVPITSYQVYAEVSSFEVLVKPILNKPKPKPKAATPPPAEKTEEGSSDGQKEQTNGTEEEQQQAAENASSEKEPHPMDVD